MKSLLLTFLFFSYISLLFAQDNIVVCGVFKSNERVKVKIYEPVNGYNNACFYSNLDSNNYVLSNTDSFYFKSNTTIPTTVEVFVTTAEDVFITKSILVLFSNDSVHLQLNFINENVESIVYNGSNNEGQKLFNDINYNPVYKFQGVIERLNTLQVDTANFVNDIDNCVYNFTSRFDSLFEDLKITAQFNEYIEVVFRQILYDFVISKFLYNYKQREVLTKEQRDTIISYFYAKQPVTNKYSKSTYHSFFIYLIITIF
jgi:hypothetical protein